MRSWSYAGNANEEMECIIDDKLGMMCSRMLLNRDESENDIDEGKYNVIDRKKKKTMAIVLVSAWSQDSKSIVSLDDSRRRGHIFDVGSDDSEADAERRVCLLLSAVIAKRHALWRLNVDILKFEYSDKTNSRYPSRMCDLDNSTSNVLIPLDSWTSGLLVYKLPLSGDLDNSTNNVLIPLDSWTSGLLVYKLPLSVEYGVSTSIGYDVSSSLSNTSYSSQQINTAQCMIRRSTNELFTPYKDPEREFRSLRRNFKTLSLDELRPPDFNLLSDQEYSEEEEAEAMAETMEQYMSKTQADYGSGFLIKYCPPDRTAKKIEEINNFQQEPDETLYQACEHFKELLMKCPQHYLTEMQETAKDAKKAIQEMVEYSQKWHNGTSRGRSTETSDGLVAIQAQLNNLRREIKKVNEKVYAAQVGCEQCRGPHYTKD
ncbi:hypothetical protein Tco_1122057 [Tanacetum coccineum]|uniref:Retrotransposon gag domain-containing protein n=1 Tax=Tanacetum coccineum TaxID=301880 RepID=A0ABQ5J1R5_9ASTR